MASDTVEIKGLQKTSLIDYPGRVCCVIFFGGCDFHCPFCHNTELVLNPEKLPAIPEEEFLGFLTKRKKWLDGVVLGGGEPCIQQGLPGFIRKIKNLGFLVKLDTNGSKPEMLERLLKEKLLDYVAMDIKASLEKYDQAAGVKVNKNTVQRSIDLIRNSGVEYEFRITVLPRLHSKQDLFSIGKWLRGSRRFFIQQFRNEKTLNPEFQKEDVFKPEELNEFKDMLKPYFKEVEVRGT